MHFLVWKLMNFKQYFLKCVPYRLIDIISSLVQIKAWRRISDRSLSDLNKWLSSLLGYICVNWLQWVNRIMCRWFHKGFARVIDKYFAIHMSHDMLRFVVAAEFIHRDRATWIYVWVNYGIFSLNNGLSTVRHLAIISTNPDISPIKSEGNYFGKMLFQIYVSKISFKKMSSFKMSSAKGGRYVSTSTSIEAETNRRHFTSGIFKRISLNEIIRILIKCHWTLFLRVGLTKSRRWLHSVSMSTWLQAMIKANNALFDWRIHGHSALHDDVIKWKHFPSNWPSVWGNHRSAVNSSHKDPWHGVWCFFPICAWINYWINNREDGDLVRHRAHYDVIVMDEFMIANSALWLIMS